MEESREIVLKSLENSGVRVPNDVSSVRDLTPATLVSICTQSLNLVGKTTPFPTTSLPDSSVADQFKLCTDIAAVIKTLGYLAAADLSFHQLLYPSEEDSYKLIRFLVERLSDVKDDSFESNVEEVSVDDVSSFSAGEFNEDGVTRALNGEDSTEKMRNREKLLGEEVNVKTSELEHLEEELELLQEAADMSFGVDHTVEFYVEKLNKQVGARKDRVGKLKSQCIVYANNPDAQERLQKLKGFELEKESILSEIRKREDELSKLSTDLEKQPKLAPRRSYIERVKEITKNSRKQEADIEKILKDTRELQLESNSIQERLHRTYAVVDEMVFREAKKDAVGRQAYRLLTSIHETFEQIREKILATDRMRREVAEHEKKLAAMASRSLNVDKLQADLDAVRRENEYLEKSLQDK